MSIDKAAHELVCAFVARLETLEDEISVINEDKKEVYAEARSKGLDTKALKAVLARRRKDQNQLSLFDAVVEQYELALKTPVTTRAPAGAARADAHVA